jgi:hypothetical protein
MKQFLLIFSILLSFTVFGQEELRYENRQFFQGKKEITYNEFRDIIGSTKNYRIYDGIISVIPGMGGLFGLTGNTTFRELPNNGQNIALLLIGFGGFLGALQGGGIGGSEGFINSSFIGAGVGVLSGIPIIIYDKKRFRRGDYLPMEEKKFKRITKRYNESISGQ